MGQMGQPPPLSPTPPPLFGTPPSPGYEPGPSAGFSIGEAFSRGWGIVTRHYAVVLVGPLLLTLASIVGGIIPIIGTLIGIAVIPFWSTLLYQCVRADRGLAVEPMGFINVSGATYGWLLLLGLVNGVISLIAALPLIVVAIVVVVMVGTKSMDPGAGIAVGATLGLAALIGSLYVSARLFFAPLLFLDAPPGTLDIIGALKLSWARSGPYAWGIVGMLLLLTLVTMGSMLLLCVGLYLIGIPLALAVEGAAYNMICPPTGGACPNCGYDLRATPGRPCPECGCAATAQAPPSV